ncbi:MAG: hypothetical protein D6800_00905, partial [Candidatus Zixiibacteriota bacterium]
MKTRWLVIILALAMLCVGCLDYEQTLTINKDGSGTITMRYAIDKAYLQQMEAMTAGLQESMGEQTEPVGSFEQTFDKENIKAQLAANQWGIALTDYTVSETDEARVWTMSFSFKDINNLWQVYGLIGSEEGDDTTGEMPAPMYRKQADGTWLYEVPLNDAASTEETAGMTEEEATEPSESSEEAADDFAKMSPEEMKEMGMSDSMIQAMQQLQEMANSMVKQMAKHKIRFVTTFPGKIVESNATKVEGNTATWEFPLTQLEKAAPT